MKIVCDNCATKYQIADEKVSGKAFKIRCKKCGHVIVVNKGAGEGGGSQAPEPAASVNQDAAPPPAEAAPPSDAVWHLVIEREQVGPMTPDEVRGKVKAGQVDAETYGWREGFDDWLKLSAIEDFKSLFAVGEEQATKRLDNAARALQAGLGGAAPAADLFGAIGKDEPIRTANPGAATIVSDGMHAPDLAALGLSPPADAAPAAPAYSPPAAQAPMMAAQAPMAAQGGGAMDAPVKSMTGARSENSVLFSLNNLSALAGAAGGGGGGGGRGGGGGGETSSKAGGGDKPNYGAPASEASGLIDIRAMAAATLGPPGGGMGASPSSRGPDMFASNDAPPVFTPLAPAMLMPSNESGGVPKWVFALVGVGVLMFAGMIAVLVVVLREPSTTPVATNVPPKETGTVGTTTSPGTTKDTPSGTTPSAVAGTPGSTTSPGTKPPATDNAANKPSGSSEKKPKESGGHKESKPSRDKEPKETKETKPDKGPDLTPTKPEPKPEKKEKPAKAKDDLDSLLDTASSGSGGKPKQSEKKDLPEQLSMSAIQGALKKVDVSSCKGEGASGVIKIKLTIKGNGKADASPADGAAGGDCVAKQVKKASFGEFSGDPMSLTYPFIVR